jgi:hypothetical protein
MSDLSCDRMRELAPELALDVLTGYERAIAQAHLNQCPECRAYVGSLTRVSDRLLSLVPSAEPPVGFEDRVLSRMGLTAPPARGPERRRWPLIAVAAAVAALVFGFGGWVVGNNGFGGSHSEESAEDGGQVLRFAALRSNDQRQIGQVFTYEGTPSWVYMSVATDPDAGTVSCQLEKSDGTYIPVGSFPLASGKGSWGAQMTADPSDVVGARLVSTNSGAVLATATFVGSGYPVGGHPK